MTRLPKALSISAISAAIILLAASSSGCEDCLETGVIVSDYQKSCNRNACCDADASCVAVGYVGDANRGYVCSGGSSNNSRGSSSRLTGP